MEPRGFTVQSDDCTAQSPLGSWPGSQLPSIKSCGTALSASKLILCPQNRQTSPWSRTLHGSGIALQQTASWQADPPSFLFTFWGGGVKLFLYVLYLILLKGMNHHD